jgi:hypothetical protein
MMKKNLKKGGAVGVCDAPSGQSPKKKRMGVSVVLVDTERWLLDKYWSLLYNAFSAPAQVLLLWDDQGSTRM